MLLTSVDIDVSSALSLTFVRRVSSPVERQKVTSLTTLCRSTAVRLVDDYNDLASQPHGVEVSIVQNLIS